MATHTVRAGENLTVIAKKYGYPDWRTIYNDPKNADFRRKRPNPNLILPGDLLFIPDKTPIPAPPVFKVEFSLTVFDKHSSGRFPNLTLTLILPNGTTKVVKTDKDGAVKLVEPDITAGKVNILSIVDNSASPDIYYPAYVASGLTTNASHVLHVPNKRKVADEIAAAHAITRRSSWGKRKPNYLKMDADWDYEIVAIHHSGDGGSKDPVEIETKHMTTKGYDDVGYHYMVKPNGDIYEGRYLWLKGSHVEKANTGKIGILLMGDFEPQAILDWNDDDPFPAQIAAAEKLIKTLKGKFATITKMGGHKDYKKDTECPGSLLYAKIPGMRTNTGLSGP